ncbi:uncharacterized protein [Diabrotica undecimpunctata]|uniref:uncharacterized protein n=1 Tax=Diabrotica undecimpunctata TaxID=50387 RepID=UPI003B635378
MTEMEKVLFWTTKKEHLLRLTRRRDRIMSVPLNIGNTNVNITCAYAPQVGCDVQEKEEFWIAVDCEILKIPVDKKYFIRGNLNRLISTERAGIKIVPVGLGIGIRNDEGNSVTDFAVACDLAVLNTFFM